MKEDLIQLPEAEEIKELLAMAKGDLQERIETHPELKEEGALLNQVMEIVESKIGKEKDFSKLNLKAKIDLAAHLSFMENLLEDLFFDEFDEEFDEEFYEEEMEER